MRPHGVTPGGLKSAKHDGTHCCHLTVSNLHNMRNKNITRVRLNIKEMTSANVQLFQRTDA